MNGGRLTVSKFLKMVVAFNALIMVGGLIAVTSAQSASSTAAPPSSVGYAEGTGYAGYVVPDTVYVPDSSIERAGDEGLFAHTNYVLRTTNGAPPAPMASPSLTEAETPASLGCVYEIGPSYPGCNPATGGTRHLSGGWGAIALVDAFDNPDAATDIAKFDATFGLPPASFTKVFAYGNGACTTPPGNKNWGLEEALDIEWAHVFAPSITVAFFL